MKVLQKALILLFNLCLFVSAIILPALSIARSPEYYYREFEKNGIYSTVAEDGSEIKTTIYYIDGTYSKATFEDEQLDALANHIVDFLFGDTESFYLEMDGVMLNGHYSDGVSIFGKTAVSHMDDVKVLMQTALVFAIISAVVAVGLLILFFVRKKDFAPYLLKYTLIFYAVILALVLIFCVWTLSDIGGFKNIAYFPDQMWSNMHHILFPFQPEKYENSFFNDTLTQILTLELFLDAIVIVFSVALALVLLWIGTAIMIKKRAGLKN